MKGNGYTPDKVSRQRRALEQRERELAEYRADLSGERPRAGLFIAKIDPSITDWSGPLIRLALEDKVATAEADIANLKRKLRV